MAAAVSLALVAGCPSTAATLPAQCDAGSTAPFAREVALDANGVGAELALPALETGGSLFVRVSSADPSTCVQIEALTDGAGTTLVAPGDYGLWCAKCADRMTVAYGAGAYVVPSSLAPWAPGAFTVRVATRDCATFLPKAGPSSLRVEATPIAPDRGDDRQIELVPVRTSSSSLDDAAMADAVSRANFLFAAGKVRVIARPICSVPFAADSLSFAAGELSSLGAMVDAARAACPDLARPFAIPVYLAGCLLENEPLLGMKNEVLGYTTHVPGGVPAGAGIDGVLVKGLVCDVPVPTAATWSPEALGKVLAHELGHYLGLYHAVENDGRQDQLSDTDATNLMNAKPSLASVASGFSASQLGLMRKHLYARPLNEAPPPCSTGQ